MNWGGIIAGALGGGAQAAQNYLKDKSDWDNRRDFAKFQADLDVDKAQRVAEMQQALDLKKFDTSSPNSYGSKAIAFDAAKATATGNAQTGVEADRLKTLAPIQQKNAVDQANALEEAKRNGIIASATNQPYLDATATLEKYKLQKLNPGEEVSINGKVIASNNRMTMPEVYAAGLRGSGGSKPDHFDAKEVDAGRKDLLKQVNETFSTVSSDTGKAIPIASASNLGLQAYNSAVRQGAAPGEAQQIAYSAVNDVVGEARSLLESPKYKDTLKGDTEKAVRLVLDLRKKKMQEDANPGPSPAPSPAPVPPRPTTSQVSSSWDDKSGSAVFNYNGKAYSSKADADAARVADQKKIEAAYNVPDIVALRNERYAKDGLGPVTGYSFNGKTYRTEDEARMAQQAYRDRYVAERVKALSQ